MSLSKQRNKFLWTRVSQISIQYEKRKKKKKLFEFTISFRGDGDGAWEALLSWCVPRWVCQLITECCSVPCRVVCSVYFYSFTGHWRVPLEDVDPPRRYYLGFGMQRIQMPPGYYGVYRATDTPVAPTHWPTLALAMATVECHKSLSCCNCRCPRLDQPLGQ